MRQVVEMVSSTWDAQTRVWGTIHVQRPNWDQVASAIRSLDPAACPRLDIVLNEVGSPENWLSISGGEGKYTLSGTTGDGWGFHFLDMSKEGGATMIFTADEGFAPDECVVCTDTEMVVRIARFFVQCNAFYPRVGWEVNWEPQEPSTEDVRRVFSALSKIKRVLIDFRNGPLDGFRFDSHSIEEPERWDVAWLLAKAGNGRLGCYFREIDRLQSLTQCKIEGKYELRSKAENEEERHLLLVYRKPSF